MPIPTFLHDMSIIQKLDDQPNAMGGLTAAELKAKFDEGGLALQQWLNNTLLPALTAQNLPFTATSEIDAANVQDAIAHVHGQVRDAAAGTIVDGSVTKAKLSAALLERVFGGVPWVALDLPTANDGVAGGFPLGQVWLRPGHAVENLAGSWSCSGCAVTDGVVRGDKSLSTAVMRQSLGSIGQAGDRVLVSYRMADKNQEVTAVTLEVNGVSQAADGTTVAATLGSGGSLSVEFTTRWSSAALAEDGWTLERFAIVNPDAVLRQAGGARDRRDWQGYLTALGAFSTVTEPHQLLIQTADGCWWPLLTDAPADGFLMKENGRPAWKTTEETVQHLGALRAVTGIYTGDGQNRTVTLPVTPVLLVLSPDEVTTSSVNMSTWEEPVVLRNGAMSKRYVSSGGTSWVASVQLQGNALVFHGQNGNALLANHSGAAYTWLAIY